MKNAVHHFRSAKIIELVHLGARGRAALPRVRRTDSLKEINMFGWTRSQVGLHVFVDTTPSGLSTAQSKVDADTYPTTANTPTAAEATYQTDRTSLTGADTGLKMNLAENKVVLTAANPGQ